MIYLFTIHDEDDGCHIHYFYAKQYILAHNSNRDSYWKWRWYEDISCLGDSNEIINIKKFDIVLSETLICIDDNAVRDDNAFYEELKYYIDKIIFEKL